MKLEIKPLEKLHDAVPASRLFADWLTGRLNVPGMEPDRQEARRELERAVEETALCTDGTPEVPPLFGGEGATEWARSAAADFFTEEDRLRFRSQISVLQKGEADIVVTGQQPGHLGGPLYTLFKVATTVALARLRTAAGRPTVPVFWSGDDDTDLMEATGSVAWDPVAGKIRQGSKSPSGGRASAEAVMVGRLVNDPWTEAGAHYLAELASAGEGGGNPLAKDLAGIWSEGLEQGLPWSVLARRAVLRVFSGHGLVVVSGDDERLHRLGKPIYEEVLDRKESLAGLGRDKGGILAAGGWHAQIQERSLARPLFTVKGDRRVPLRGGAGSVEPRLLRPGVMLRSPLQDWLLRPAAVVVGPAEVAYLRQLDSLYEALGIERAPLVPRLFAWLLPEKFPVARLRSFREAKGFDPERVGPLADAAEGKVRQILADLLAGELGIEPDRAASLAEGRSRRWRKGVFSLLETEFRRIHQEREPALPVWVFPEGVRQERKLAFLCAAALWGDGLVEACLAAAARHLDYGARGDWREFAVQVPDPRSTRGTQAP